MDILGAIQERRSIRRYTDTVPEDEVIRGVLEAASWAPSGLNNQPWKFLVIKDPARKKELAGFTKYGDVIDNAPVAVCVFLDNGATYNREKDIMAVGACIENLLLAAYAHGLGTCWLGEILNRKKDAGAFLGTGEDHELMAVVTLGYSDEEVTRGCRKNLESLILE